MLTKIHDKVYNIEKLLIILAFISLGLLFIFQFFHIRNSTGSSHIYYPLLTQAEHAVKPVFSAGKITLSVHGDKSETQSLFVLVNGEVYTEFVHNTAEIIVRNHDVISVENRNKSESSLQLEVINVTKTISSPQLNSRFSLDQNTDQLFTVEFY